MAPIEMIIPNREDVLNDIIAIKKQHEDYGIQLVTKELQKRHPEWNIKDKRVRKIMRKEYLTTPNGTNQEDHGEPVMLERNGKQTSTSSSSTTDEESNQLIDERPIMSTAAAVEKMEMQSVEPEMSSPVEKSLSHEAAKDTMATPANLQQLKSSIEKANQEPKATDQQKTADDLLEKAKVVATPANMQQLESSAEKNMSNQATETSSDQQKPADGIVGKAKAMATPANMQQLKSAFEKATTKQTTETSSDQKIPEDGIVGKVKAMATPANMQQLKSSFEKATTKQATETDSDQQKPADGIVGKVKAMATPANMQQLKSSFEKATTQEPKATETDSDQKKPADGIVGKVKAMATPANMQQLKSSVEKAMSNEEHNSNQEPIETVEDLKALKKDQIPIMATASATAKPTIEVETVESIAQIPGQDLIDTTPDVEVVNGESVLLEIVKDTLPRTEVVDQVVSEEEQIDANDMTRAKMESVEASINNQTEAVLPVKVKEAVVKTEVVTKAEAAVPEPLTNPTMDRQCEEASRCRCTIL